MAIQSELCPYNQEPSPIQVLENRYDLDGIEVQGNAFLSQGYRAKPIGNDDYP